MIISLFLIEILCHDFTTAEEVNKIEINFSKKFCFSLKYCFDLQIGVNHKISHLFPFQRNY